MLGLQIRNHRWIFGLLWRIVRLLLWAIFLERVYTFVRRVQLWLVYFIRKVIHNRQFIRAAWSNKAWGLLVLLILVYYAKLHRQAIDRCHRHWILIIFVRIVRLNHLHDISTFHAWHGRSRIVFVLTYHRFYLTFSLFLYDSQMVLHKAIKVIWVVIIFQEVLIKLAVEGSISTWGSSWTCLWWVWFHTDTCEAEQAQPGLIFLGFRGRMKGSLSLLSWLKLENPFVTLKCGFSDIDISLLHHRHDLIYIELGQCLSCGHASSLRLQIVMNLVPSWLNITKDRVSKIPLQETTYGWGDQGVSLLRFPVSLLVRELLRNVDKILAWAPTLIIARGACGWWMVRLFCVVSHATFGRGRLLVATRATPSARRPIVIAEDQAKIKVDVHGGSVPSK